MFEESDGATFVEDSARPADCWANGSLTGRRGGARRLPGPKRVGSPALRSMMAATGDPADDYLRRDVCPLRNEVAFCMLGGFGIRMQADAATYGSPSAIWRENLSRKG